MSPVGWGVSIDAQRWRDKQKWTAGKKSGQSNTLLKCFLFEPAVYLACMSFVFVFLLLYHKVATKWKSLIVVLLSEIHLNVSSTYLNKIIWTNFFQQKYLVWSNMNLFFYEWTPRFCISIDTWLCIIYLFILSIKAEISWLFTITLKLGPQDRFICWW